jgi:hypothetical protein
MFRFRNIGCWIIAFALVGCTTAGKQQQIFDAGADQALDVVEFELVEGQTHEALRQGFPLPPNGTADQMRHTEDPDPGKPAPVASACMHLAYRNPVVDRILIPGGLRGGVYIPTHYEYVVYQTGRWEVVSSVGNPQTTMPAFPPGCRMPPREKQP